MVRIISCLRCPSGNKIALTLLILAWYLLPVVHADNYSELVRVSGLRDQYEQIPGLIEQAALEHLESCANPTLLHKQDISRKVANQFQSDRLNQQTAAALAEVLHSDQLDSILRWYKSDAGRRIRSAELSGEEFSDSEYRQLLSSITATEDWTKKRLPLIRAVLTETKTHRYITMIDTELEALGADLGACDQTAQGKAKIQSNRAALRKDQALLAFFMIPSLIQATAVTYREVDDQTLREYIRFAGSKAGKAFHNALLSVIPEVLNGINSEYDGRGSEVGEAGGTIKGGEVADRKSL